MCAFSNCWTSHTVEENKVSDLNPPTSNQKYIEIPFKDLLENNLSFPYLFDYFQEIGDDHLLFLYVGIKDLLESHHKLLASEAYIKKSIFFNDEHIVNLRTDILAHISTYLKQMDFKNIPFSSKSLLENIVKEANYSIPVVDSLRSLKKTVLNYLEEPTYLKRFYSSSKYAKLCSEINLIKKGPPGRAAEFIHSCTVLDKIFQQDYIVDSIISETLLCGQHGHEYVAYVIFVMVMLNNIQYSWKVHHRFRHFVELHENLIAKFPNINAINFPEKKIVGNKNNENIEKRKTILDSFLKSLLNHELFKKNETFFAIVTGFLDKRTVSGSSEQKQHQRSGSRNSESFSNLENYEIPEFPTKPEIDSPFSKNPSFNFDDEKAESLSLSILVNLIEELFDIRAKTPWLARQIKTFVKDIFIVTVGDRVKRKIFDEIDYYFSVNGAVEYLNRLKESFWPNNIWNDDFPLRGEKIKARERIIASSVLIGSLPTELRRFLGEEVSLDGIYKLFNMLQIQPLNKRLFYSILEVILEALFPDNSHLEITKNLNEAYIKS
ncbi:hypothetical protein HZS_1564 [Henneguya salminicola]|nr:hypothetical protein HZS_1564 [Henneguya salminicola]